MIAISSLLKNEYWSIQFETDLEELEITLLIVIDSTTATQINIEAIGLRSWGSQNVHNFLNPDYHHSGPY